MFHLFIFSFFLAFGAVFAAFDVFAAALIGSLSGKMTTSLGPALILRPKHSEAQRGARHGGSAGSISILTSLTSGMKPGHGSAPPRHSGEGYTMSGNRR